jgi:hypothetical protein
VWFVRFVPGQAASLTVGTDKLSFGYGGAGKKSFNGKFEDYGGNFGALFALSPLPCLVCLSRRLTECVSHCFCRFE